jgi:hypothetical protein
MRRYIFIFLMGLLPVLPQCKSQTPTQNSMAFTFDSFILGWGGGFTGLYEEYRLSLDGSVRKMDFDNGNFEEYGSFPTKEVQKIFRELEVLSPRTIYLNNPGDLTNYLEVFNKEQSHRITWGGNQSAPPEDLLQFFQRTREKLKNSK